MAKSNKMSNSAVARIQKANAPRTGGQTPKGSFIARAQSARARNAKSVK